MAVTTILIEVEDPRHGNWAALTLLSLLIPDDVPYLDLHVF